MSPSRRELQQRAQDQSWWRPVVSGIVAFLAISYYLTGNFLGGYRTRWTNSLYIRFRLFEGPQVFTDEALSKYDGRNPDLPIYLAINGTVFDVSANPATYGPLGPYRFFSGRDGARAFATGCFDSDLTHDLRGLDTNQLEAVRGWHSFFFNNVRYWPVGTVIHEAPRGDPPPPCQRAVKPT